VSQPDDLGRTGVEGDEDGEEMLVLGEDDDEEGERCKRESSMKRPSGPGRMRLLTEEYREQGRGRRGFVMTSLGLRLSLKFEVEFAPVVDP